MSASTPIVCRVRTLELDAPPDPPAWLEAWRDAGHAWLLESALPVRGWGRWSFAGGDPWLVLRAWGERIELDCRRPVRPDLAVGRTRICDDPFETVRRWLGPRIDAVDAAWAGLPFVGGAVGVFGYELAEWTEPVRLHARDDRGAPDLTLLGVDRLVAVDGESGRSHAVGLGYGRDAHEAEAAAGRALEAAAARAPAARRVASRSVGSRRASPRRGAAARGAKADAPEGRRPLADLERVPGMARHFDEASYAKAVASVQDEIAAGNVYQVNLSQRLDLPFEGDAWSLYRALRATNPAPFAAYLELPDAAVVGSSPERFLRLEPDGRVECRPIKGTRPRGATPAEDQALRRVLACSQKDRAENLMIVDLVRNDLGRVCRTGSVRVPELMVVEDYASVFQMVSSVTGRLRPEADVVDLLRATFPPGSMTGAPKLAALHRIDRLEPVRRGIYSGCLGYLDVRGGADLSVVIRTWVVSGGRASLSVGGGIVADSDPVAEYRETLDKAQAPLHAWHAAKGGDVVS